MKNNYNICSKMWTDTNINFDKKSIKHCCKQSNNPISIDDLDQYKENVFEGHLLNISNRKEMVLENKLPLSCKWCIDTEPNSIKNVWNVWSDNWIERNKDKLISGSFVNYIELDIGRSCDMACIYCGPWSSTTWAKELGDAVDNKLDPEWRDLALTHLAEYIQKIPSSQHVTFNILGGEPLLLVDTYKIIDFISKHCGHFDNRPRLMITTNLNCKPKLLQRLIGVMEKTRDVFEWDISVSIENVGEYAEAVRYHLDWDVFESNLKAIKPHADKIYLTTTFNILSFAHFAEFIDWTFEVLGADTYTQHWDFSLNAVQEGFTDIAYCPKQYIDIQRIKDRYLEHIEKADELNDNKVLQFLGHLDNMYERLETKTYDTEFTGFWQVMSVRRGINYLELHPLKQIVESK